MQLVLNVLDINLLYNNPTKTIIFGYFGVFGCTRLTLETPLAQCRVLPSCGIQTACSGLPSWPMVGIPQGGSWWRVGCGHHFGARGRFRMGGTYLCTVLNLNLVFAFMVYWAIYH
jgi:hypothetical protein